MQRLIEEIEHARLLDRPAGIHHDDAVGDLGDDAEIVGDQQMRRAEAALEIRISPRICAWIVTSSAVVGSSAIEDARLAGERQARSSRAAASRRTVRADTAERAAPGPACGQGAASPPRARAPRAGRRDAPQHLRDLVADRHHRIERSERILEDHVRCGRRAGPRSRA